MEQPGAHFGMSRCGAEARELAHHAYVYNDACTTAHQFTSSVPISLVAPFSSHRSSQGGRLRGGEGDQSGGQ